MRSFQFGLYDPVNPRSRVRRVGEVFQGTRADRLMVRYTLRRFRAWAAKHSDVLLCLGVFPARRKAVQR